MQKVPATEGAPRWPAERQARRLRLPQQPLRPQAHLLRGSKREQAPMDRLQGLQHQHWQGGEIEPGPVPGPALARAWAWTATAGGGDARWPFVLCYPKH